MQVQPPMQQQSGPFQSKRLPGQGPQSSPFLPPAKLDFGCPKKSWNSNDFSDLKKNLSPVSRTNSGKAVSWNMDKNGTFKKMTSASSSKSSSISSAPKSTSPKADMYTSQLKPGDTQKNRKAAICLQRMFRGWWQRLQFKVKLLEYKVKNKDALTEKAIEKVQERVEARKQAFEKKTLEAMQKELAKLTDAEKCAYESQRIIDYLRKENKKLREKNQKIHVASINMTEQNERLRDVNKHTGETFSELNKHAKHISETHDKLVYVVPQYKESIAELQEALDLRNQYATMEHKTKLLYLKCAGQVVSRVEEGCKDPALVDEIVGYALEMEESSSDEKEQSSSKEQKKKPSSRSSKKKSSSRKK